MINEDLELCFIYAVDYANANIYANAKRECVAVSYRRMQVKLGNNCINITLYIRIIRLSNSALKLFK